jgi:hypothetical protein
MTKYIITAEKLVFLEVTENSLHETLDILLEQVSFFRLRLFQRLLYARHSTNFSCINTHLLSKYEDLGHQIWANTFVNKIKSNGPIYNITHKIEMAASAQLKKNNVESDGLVISAGLFTSLI